MIREIEEYGLTNLFQEIGKEIETYIWDYTKHKENQRFAERADIGITFSDITLAESATVTLFHHKGHGRSISLLPKSYIAIIPKETIVPRMTQAAQQIHAAITRRRRPTRRPSRCRPTHAIETARGSALAPPDEHSGNNAIATRARRRADGSRLDGSPVTRCSRGRYRSATRSPPDRSPRSARPAPTFAAAGNPAGTFQGRDEMRTRNSRLLAVIGGGASRCCAVRRRLARGTERPHRSPVGEHEVDRVRAGLGPVAGAAADRRRPGLDEGREPDRPPILLLRLRQRQAERRRPAGHGRLDRDRQRRGAQDRARQEHLPRLQEGPAGLRPELRLRHALPVPGP